MAVDDFGDFGKGAPSSKADMADNIMRGSAPSYARNAAPQVVQNKAQVAPSTPSKDSFSSKQNMVTPMFGASQPQSQASQSLGRLQSQETTRPAAIPQAPAGLTSPRVQGPAPSSNIQFPKGGDGLLGVSAVDKAMNSPARGAPQPINSGGQPLKTKSNDGVQNFNARGYVDGVAGQSTSLKAPAEQGHNFPGIPKQDGTFGGMIENRKAIIAAGGNPGYQQPLVPDYNKRYDRAYSSVAGDLVHDTAVGLGNKLANGAIGVGNFVGGLFGGKQNWRDTSKDVPLRPDDVPKAQEGIAKQRAQEPKFTGPAGGPGSGQANMQAVSTPEFQAGLGAPTSGFGMDNASMAAIPKGGYGEGRSQSEGARSSLTGNERPAFDPYKVSARHEDLIHALASAKPGTPESYKIAFELKNEYENNKLSDHKSSGLLYTDKGSDGQVVPGQIGAYGGHDGSGGLVNSTNNRPGYSQNELSQRGQEAEKSGGLVPGVTDKAEAQMMKRWQDEIAGGKWGADGAARDMAAYLNNKEQFHTQTETNRLSREDNNDYRRQQLEETKAWHQSQRESSDLKLGAGGKGKGGSAADRQNLETLKSYFPGKDEDRSDMFAAAEILDKSPVWAEEFAHNPNRVVTRIKKIMSITKSENEANKHWGRPDGPQMSYGGMGALNHEMPDTVTDMEGLKKFYADDTAGNY